MKTRNYAPAKLRSSSYSESDNTIDIIWSTGADVLREDWDGSYVERLSMEPSAVRLDRLNSGAPFLNTHRSDDLGDVIGSIVPGSARIEDGKGLATVKLSGAACDADTVLKIREGVIKNISVGYWTHHSIRQAGEKGQPDVLFVDDWEPLEISAVPIPADAGAQIRSANARKRPSQRLTPEQRDYANGAAAARRLLQPAQSRVQARGAAVARKLKAAGGAALDKGEFERGARAAKRLLGKRA